jgi:hypothetical protein
MTEAIIRSAADQDLPEVLALYRHLHPHDPELDTATVGRVWSTLLASPFMTVIVAQADDRLVSSCTLAIVPNLSRGGRSYAVTAGARPTGSCPCDGARLAGRLLQGVAGDRLEAGKHAALL